MLFLQVSCMMPVLQEPCKTMKILQDDEQETCKFELLYLQRHTTSERRPGPCIIVSQLVLRNNLFTWTHTEQLTCR